jgi:hypothetical protein
MVRYRLWTIASQLLVADRGSDTVSGYGLVPIPNTYRRFETKSVLRVVPMLVAALILSVASAGIAQTIRTGPAKKKRKVIRDGEYVEVYVDEQGKIYRERRYKGVIPKIRDHLGKKAPPRNTRFTHITWVGFQQRQLFSRVFVQTNRLTHFTLHKPDPLHIVVTFDNARVPRRNDRRIINTSAFRSVVKKIQATRRGKQTRVTITLRKRAGYLYKQEGNYVFIDVER